MPGLIVTYFTETAEDTGADADRFRLYLFTAEPDSEGVVRFRLAGQTGHIALTADEASRICNTVAAVLGGVSMQNVNEGDELSKSQYRALFSADLPGSEPTPKETRGYPAREVGP